MLPRPLLLIALAGSDLLLLLQRRQSLGCNGSDANLGTFLLAARGSRIGLDCRARATWGLVDGASYDDRLYVPSPMDGEVIWKGSGGGESASA